MYQIKCDNNIIYDVRDESLKLINPKVNLEVNTVGSAAFTIYNNHPCYGLMAKLKSVFEVSDEIGVIFRGRQTSDTLDFYKGKAVALEGAMAFFNDSIVRPFKFPEDYDGDTEYQTAATSGNVVRFFLKKIIENHNSQTEEFQHFKLGTVTVSDPNNYITRSSEGYNKSWDILKNSLFESSLGGYLCIRYEDDGNYIDYLSEFTLTNTQRIRFGENLLDVTSDSDASEVFSAILPIGATTESEVDTGDTDEDGNQITETVSHTVTLADLSDFEESDIVKDGDTLYSKAAVESYGFIYAPVDDSSWDDVTEASNLLTKARQFLESKGVMLSNTITVSAADMHFTDSEVQTFRIYRKQIVESNFHNLSESYNLIKLSIDIVNPQNTEITIGETKQSLIDQNLKAEQGNIEKIQNAYKDIKENRRQVSEVRKMQLTEETRILNDCQSIILEATKEFISTGNLDEYKETINAALKVMSDTISLNFTTVTDQVNNVDGDLQEEITKLSKYFDFRQDGLTIKTGNGYEMQLLLDNDIISFKKNGVQFGWWDGVDFHTGNIIVDVNEKAQFGNFAFVPRTDGSLSFLKVGGS